MAEYKYRALGWKDDDIASLNVVDGKAADNQVELQITKQGAGGTIDGPAIIGKDGITINKAADSEKIEISGSGLLQKDTRNTGARRAYTVNEDGTNQEMMNIDVDVGPYTVYSLARRDGNVSLHGLVPDSPTDTVLLNKKYVDDNYVKKDTSVAKQQVYGHSENGKPQMFYVTTGNANPYWLCMYQAATLGATQPSGNGRLITQDPTQPYQAANKHYVDEADKLLRLKLSNLEQALNGYILDTTKEAYADLDSAVLKNSVAVGDNVYPIADKTRALVTRIEGKTTKMVQLANTEALENKQINNGITLIKNTDGSLTANGTATAKTWGLFAIGGSYIKTVAGSKYLLLGSPNGYGRDTYHLMDSNGKIEEGDIKTLDGSALSIRVVFTEGFVAENITFRPQLFNLTAIYGEGNEPTTVEQFKSEFPDLYPYENGNIYPAKISGVKFTGKNLFDINQFENYKQNDTTEIKVINDKLSIVGYPVSLPNSHYFSNLIRSLKPNTQYAISVNISNYISDSSGVIAFMGKNNVDIKAFSFYRNGYNSDVFSLTQEDIDTFDHVQIYGNNNTKPPLIMTNLQIEENSAPTAYEPYTEPVSVTLPEAYDLHGIGDYKDYLEITKNENNELYTLKKIQVIDKHVFDGTENWSSYGSSDFTNLAYGTASLGSKFINWQSRASLMNLFNRITISKDAEGYAHGDSSADLYIRLPNIATAADMKAHVLSMYEAGTPYIFYGAIVTPVETVIATNLTYEQVTAIRHNGGLIEVEGNTNKAYARPTVTNTIVYRLTAANTVEG